MNSLKLAQELVKTAKSLVAEEKLLATNRSSWSWEDDANERIAELFLDGVYLRLDIREIHTKYGLGAGVRETTLEDASVGTVTKPNLGLIRSLLAKHSHERTRAGGPFKKSWHKPDKTQSDLKTIIEEARQASGGGPDKTNENVKNIFEKLDAELGDMSKADLQALLKKLEERVKQG